MTEKSPDSPVAKPDDLDYREIVKQVWKLVMSTEVKAQALDTPTLTTRQVKDALMSGHSHE